MASSARIDELRKKFDENPRRYFAPLANEFRKAGDLEQAVFICQEYLPQQPGHMSGHIVYGQALFELGRDEEAKAVFETALSLDPENLIALRHLGDIARQAGDADVARFWYQRVLESDPRNDEIAQILMSLDAARGESAPQTATTAPAATIAEPLAVGSTEEPPPVPGSHAEAVTEGAVTAAHPASPVVGSGSAESPATAEPESFEPFEGFDRTIDFDQPVSTPLASEQPPHLPPELPPELPDEVPVTAEPAAEAMVPESVADEFPLAAVSAVQADTEELLDLEDFSIGGASIAPPAEQAASVAEPAEVPETAATEPGGIEAIERESAFEFEVAGELESNDRVPVESSTAAAMSGDASVGDESPSEVEAYGATFEPEPLEPEATEKEPGPDAAALDEIQPEPVIELATDISLGLPSDEPEPPVSVTQEAESPPELPGEVAAAAGEVEAFASADATDMAETSVAEPTDAAEPAEAPTPDATDEAFATETMASLYVQQGHFANALEIYEKLLAHAPDDSRLQARIREIKEHIYGKPRDTVWEPEPLAAEVAPAPAAAAPTSIREFLRGVIAPRAAGASSNGGTPPVELDPAPSPAAPAETVTGSIDALFANAAPSDEDRSAASALAQAFGEWPEPTPIHGVPAHEASSELSLDHVFRANAPVPRRDDADAFSFDQFFSDESGEQAPGGENPPRPGAPESSDDIAQFNAWLNGLKKT